MSSVSNALDSIASCSDDEDEKTCPSDEETGSSYTEYDEENNQGNHPPVVEAKNSKNSNNNAKVWKYGEPTKTSVSAHDQLMERERLIQEDYEFKLHLLKRENERLARRFRLFVLVTVASVLVGALTFSFVMCIHMLLS